MLLNKLYQPALSVSGQDGHRPRFIIEKFVDPSLGLIALKPMADFWIMRGDEDPPAITFLRIARGSIRED
jgi:hypothetical protein